MISLGRLFGDMQGSGVALFPYDVGPQRAVALEMKGKYAIFIDPLAFPTVGELAGAMAHELGHCETGATHRVSSRYDLIEKHEYKANRWAIERYLPWEELNAAVTGGLTEPWQLAEYFGLPEAFINRAVEYYTLAREKTFGP